MEEEQTIASASELPFKSSSSDHLFVANDHLLNRFIASSSENESDDAFPLPVTWWNVSSSPDVEEEEAEFYGTSYRIVACLCISLTLIFGLVGNVMVILVVLKIRTMHTSTNCYLVSLAVADLVLLTFASMPTLVECFLIVDQYAFGSVGCSVMVFAQYLAVNVSSLTITAFTVERYVAVCRPMRIQSLCTVRRAKRIIGGLWLFGTVYSSPWLWLATTTQVHLAHGVNIYQCTFKLPRNQYLVYYMIDLLVFYVLPLVVTCSLYALIARTLYTGPDPMGEAVATNGDRPLTSVPSLVSRPFTSRRVMTSNQRNRVQVGHDTAEEITHLMSEQFIQQTTSPFEMSPS